MYIEIFRELRKRFTLHELAKIFGVSISAIRDWQFKEPSQKNKRKIDEVLNKLQNEKDFLLNERDKAVSDSLREFMKQLTKEDVECIIKLTESEKKKINEIKSRR